MEAANRMPLHPFVVSGQLQNFDVSCAKKIPRDGSFTGTLVACAGSEIHREMPCSPLAKRSGTTLRTLLKRWAHPLL
jgi:hypothetical protein